MKIGKDTLSRITKRLEGEQRAWRERPLTKRTLTPTCTSGDATYLKVNRGASVTSLALLAAVGVEEEGFREVLWRWGDRRRGEERGLLLPSPRPPGPGLTWGACLVVSADHEGIKAAVRGELPGVEWQRCIVHFARNVLAHVPASAMSEVAEDLKAIFKARREKTAKALVEEFVSAVREALYPKAVSVFEAGIGDALTYLRYPGAHHARVRTTNVLERLFEEVKRRTRVVGVFPNEMSAQTLATEIMLRSSEEWALKRYLNMEALEAVETPNPQLSRR